MTLLFSKKQLGHIDLADYITSSNLNVDLIRHRRHDHDHGNHHD